MFKKKEKPLDPIHLTHVLERGLGLESSTRGLAACRFLAVPPWAGCWPYLCISCLNCKGEQHLPHWDYLRTIGEVSEIRFVGFLRHSVWGLVDTH